MRHPPLPPRADAVIVGAGLAGAAAAYGLARRGLTDLVVLEREDVAGVHASGRNAAMAYRFIPQDEIRALAHQGLAFFTRPPEDLPLPLHNRMTGSVTVLDPGDVGRHRLLIESLAREGAPLSRWTADELATRFPSLRVLPSDVGLFSPGEGVVDVDSLLQSYLRFARRAGGQIRFRCEAMSLVVEAGRIVGLDTTEGRIRAPLVILASGPWANHLAEGAGLSPLPMRPARRHLAVVEADAPATAPEAPLVWNQSEHFYFRPESSGVLVCACDVTFWEPMDVGPDSTLVAWLAERTLSMLPGVGAGRIRRAWAGLRTLTPDDRFIVGPDPRLDGLFWVAGLAGHGMTTSPGVAELVGDLVTAGRTDLLNADALSPERFLHRKNPISWSTTQRPDP